MAVINSVRMCFITQARREGLIRRLLDQYDPAGEGGGGRGRERSERGRDGYKEGKRLK